MSTQAERAEMIETLRGMAAQIVTPNSPGKHFFNSVADELEELGLRVSDDTIRGMLTRLKRDHNELRSAWENETGKPWRTE